MPKRVNNGPGDDPDEYWFECEDCKDERSGPGTWVGDCAGCGGLGFVAGDADDVEYCNKRFHPKDGGPIPGAYWWFCREEQGHTGHCRDTAAAQRLTSSDFLD